MSDLRESHSLPDVDQSSWSDEEVEGHLQDNSPVNGPYHHDSSASLQWAVAAGDIDRVKALLSHGAESVINTPVFGVGGSQFNTYPIHIAVQLEEDALEIVELLLDHGADVNIARDWDHMTPLHLACQHGTAELFQYLLDSGARIERAWFPGLETERAYLHAYSYGVPHRCAVISGNMDALRVLMKHDRDHGTTYPDSWASEIVVACTDNGSHPDKKPCVPLSFVYLHYGDATLRDDGGDQLLAAMIDNGDEEGFEFLLENGCRPLTADASGALRRNALNEAILDFPFRREFFIAIRKFITKDAVERINRSINDDSCAEEPPVGLALRNAECLEVILELGFSPNLKLDEIGEYHSMPMRNWVTSLKQMYTNYTTLSYCVSIFGDSDLQRKMELLVKHGAPVNARDAELSPLVLLLLLEWDSRRSGMSDDSSEAAIPYDDLIAFLVENGANLSHRSSATPFQSPDLAVFAALTGNTAILRRVFAETGLDPMVLLSDLVAAEISIPDRRWGLRTDEFTRVRRQLATALLDMLNVQRKVTNRAAMVDLVVQIELKYKFEAERRREEREMRAITMQERDLAVVAAAAAIAQYGDENAATSAAAATQFSEGVTEGHAATAAARADAAIAQYADENAATDSLWRRIRDLAENVGSLQCICRATIVDRLREVAVGRNGESGAAGEGVNGHSVATLIEQLHLPPKMKNYLN